MLFGPTDRSPPHTGGGGLQGGGGDCKGGIRYFFWLTPKVQRVLKIVLGKWAELQHMIPWIPARQGTGRRPKAQKRIPEGSLVRSVTATPLQGGYKVCALHNT